MILKEKADICKIVAQDEKLLNMMRSMDVALVSLDGDLLRASVSVSLGDPILQPSSRLSPSVRG